ncbi:hypothetical protein C8J57DRAFT_1537336 [Mycena rebaudengoi]|nr:hypothetical protein C8J57DRAFT_1537336 [Mycena rebaudengoi]
MLESWEILKKTIPKFGDDMLDLGGANKIHNQVCAEIQEGVNGARRDDTSTLKHTIIDYLPPLPPMPTPAAGDTRVAVDRTTSRRKPPQTYAKIANGDIKVTGLMMPTFMCQDGQPYDSEDLDAGLLEGHTFCVAMKQIYQGPTAALQEDGYNRGKAGNTALNGITALTPHDIAYVAIQVRFVLSSVQTCSITDSKFNYSDFYWSVVDSLRREEGTEIIQCLNLNVFSTQAASKRGVPADSSDENDFNILAAQRAAKRARKAAEDAAATAVPVAPAPAAPAPADATPHLMLYLPRLL